MRKTIFPLLIGSFLFISCGPDAPPPHPSGTQTPYLREWVPPGGPIYARAALAEAGYWKCERPGVGCLIITPMPHLRTTASNAYVRFENAYDNNRVPNFCATDPDFNILFPDLDRNNSVVVKIINGIYKTFLFRDSSIAISKANNYIDSNIVMVYKIKL